MLEGDERNLYIIKEKEEMMKNINLDFVQQFELVVMQRIIQVCAKTFMYVALTGNNAMLKGHIILKDLEKVSIEGSIAWSGAKGISFMAAKRHKLDS